MSSDSSADSQDPIIPGQPARPQADASVLNDAIVIDQAENVIGQARVNELTAAVVAANRQLTAAVDRLSRAEDGGTAEQINAAREAVQCAREEFHHVAEPAVIEMQRIARARISGASDVLALLHRAQAADIAGPEPE